MTPSFADHSVSYRCFGNAEVLGERSPRYGLFTFSHGPCRSHIVGIKYRANVPVAHQARSVPQLIFAVLGRCSPAKVLRQIIGFDTVIVRGVVIRRRWRPMKCFAHKATHPEFAPLSAKDCRRIRFHQRKHAIAGCGKHPRFENTAVTPYPANRTGLIARV